MRLVSVVVLLAAAACAPSKMAAAFIVNPIRVPIIGEPTEPHEVVTFTTDDGLELEGWLFRPTGTPKGLVVLLHGKDINRQHVVLKALRFLKLGYAVLAYDQRAHGRSEGKFITYGVKEVGDLQRAMDTVALTPVYLVGESLGAAVVLQTTAKDARVKGVVSAASFADLRTLLNEKTPFFFSEATQADALAAAEREANFHIDDVSPAKAAANITVPALVIHGVDDTFIPMHHALEIYEALKGPKQLIRVEGVAHMDVLLHDEVWNDIERFVLAN